MQIDFHHAVAYVAARCAGFDHREADIVAYSSQYTDDATESGAVDFDNGAMYRRISSSHEALDLHNLRDSDNHMVWVPFHFLPGNGGKPAGNDPEGTFIRKLVCTPDSPVAEEMMASAIRDQDRPYGLHRLGVAAHVYADTWAHQGFAGVEHEINDVHNAAETGNTHVIGGLNNLLGRVVQLTAPRLGHARAGVLPDYPFLSWKYTNGRGEEIARNNTTLFCDAADKLCRAMQRFRLKDAAAQVPGLPDADKKAVHDLLANLVDLDCRRRHDVWLRQIAAGRFSFGPALVSYSETTWKAEALKPVAAQAAAGAGNRVTATLGGAVFQYSGAFLESNWKLFHDALQLHRLTVLHDILPKYGICSG